MLDLNRALERLEAQDPRKARLLELRFYLSCTTEEACEILDISHATAERDLRFARAWLFSTLRGTEPPVGGAVEVVRESGYGITTAETDESDPRG